MRSSPSRATDATGSDGRADLERLIGRAALDRLTEAAAAPDGAPLRLAIRQLLDEIHGRAGIEVTVRAHDERVERELRAARRIQRALVGPTEMDLDGWDLGSEYHPAREIGGDFFDAFPILGGQGSRRRLGLVIADVSGKGISAALLMAFVRPVLRSALDRTGDPVAALERTNQILATERRTGLFVTALCAALDLDSGVLTLASAGHEAPLVLPADGSATRWIEGGGPLLGAFPRLDLEPIEVALGPGDGFVIYTDGSTDATDIHGQRFGEDRLRAALAVPRPRSAEALVGAVIAAIDGFRGEAEPADDIAVLAIHRLAGR